MVGRVASKSFGAQPLGQHAMAIFFDPDLCANRLGSPGGLR